MAQFVATVEITIEADTQEQAQTKLESALDKAREIDGYDIINDPEEVVVPDDDEVPEP